MTGGPLKCQIEMRKEEAGGSLGDLTRPALCRLRGYKALPHTSADSQNGVRCKKSPPRSPLETSLSHRFAIRRRMRDKLSGVRPR